MSKYIDYGPDPNEQAREREERQCEDRVRRIREWARKTCDSMDPSEIAAKDTLDRYWGLWLTASGEYEPDPDVRPSYGPNPRDAFDEAFASALLDRHNRQARKDDHPAPTFEVDRLGRRTVRYWSVYDQRWEAGAYVPDQELAAMDTTERQLVRLFLGI